MPRPSRWNDIVEAAAGIFREKGFAAASLEDIASAVGIWKGSLYHYIDSKEDLLFAVVKEPAERILDEVQHIAGLDLPASERLRQAALTHARILDETFVYASVYLQEIAGRQRYQEWAERDRLYLRAMTAIIQDGIDQGAFAPATNARTTTLAFIGALNWMTHWYKPDGPLPASTIAEQICSLFLNGLIVRRSTAKSPPSVAAVAGD
jgi:TetR/AcrR family transcriptional regulator, cholesterol catabolism regulator